MWRHLSINLSRKASRHRSLYFSPFECAAATVTLPKAPHNSQGSKDFSNVAGKKERGKAKLYMTTMPLNLGELKEKFAEIDGEALEEEEVSVARRVARMTRIMPVLASVTSLHLADGILQNGVENRKGLPRSEREEVVNDTSNLMIEKAVLRIHSPKHGQEGVGIRQSMASKTPSQDQDVQVSEPTGKGKDTVRRSVHDRNAITCPARQPSPSKHLDLNGIMVSALFCSDINRRLISVPFQKLLSLKVPDFELLDVPFPELNLP